MVPQNCLITNFLQNNFLCVQNKHIHTGLEILEGEILHFWVNYPFNGLRDLALDFIMVILYFFARRQTYQICTR